MKVRGGDKMNKKRFTLLVVVSFIFVASYIFLNQKYDRFYRISGIDNEKRQMILNYLSEEEQEYLVEFSIGSERFMKYIELEDFSLFNISYYEKMEKSQKTFLNNDHLVKYTNEVVNKIKSITSKNVSDYFEELLKYKMDEIFLQSESYNLDITRFYATYYNYVGAITLNDIEQLNNLQKIMEEMEYSENYQRSFLKKWQVHYPVDVLSVFLKDKQLNPKITLIENPDSLSAIVTEEKVVSCYVPESLVIPYNVSRVSYELYLRQDAATCLEELYKACAKEISDETLLLVMAYESYEQQQVKFDQLETSVAPGSNEFQLGLLVDLCTMEKSYDEFSSTKICQFLKENAWKYGYIQRYNSDSLNYNEHIYRYVGKSAAKLIYEQQMTLEEYEGVNNE